MFLSIEHMTNSNHKMKHSPYMLPVFISILSFVLSMRINAQTQLGTDINGLGSGERFGWDVDMDALGNQFIGGAPFRNVGGITDAGMARVFEWNCGSWVQKGSSLEGESFEEEFGESVSISLDGNSVAVGTGHKKELGITKGYVKIYSWEVDDWVLKGDPIYGSAENGEFGRSISLSEDGNTIIIGAPSNSEAGSQAGQVQVYRWIDDAWTQLGENINGESANDYSGISVDIDATGDLISIGANRNSDAGTSAGHVRLFEWDGAAWIQKGEDIDGESPSSFAGVVGLSSDGTTVIIGGYHNSEAFYYAGHIRVFEWDGIAWVQKGEDIDGEAEWDVMGYGVRLSSDGNILAASSIRNDDGGTNAGKTRLFEWDGAAWIQIGTDILGENSNDQAGFKLSLNGAGTRIAIGANLNDGAGTSSGHVRVYGEYGDIESETEGIDVQEACDSYTWIDGNTYTESDFSATHTLLNIYGCDSIVSLNLTLHHSDSITDTQGSCDSYTWIDGNTYTESNDSATFTLTNIHGCDSVITLNLTIYNNESIDVQSACDSYTWIDGITYTESNFEATQTLTNIYGCDSIVTLNLTLGTSNSSTDTHTACNSFTWIDGVTYTESNDEATHLLTNVHGCDSLVTLDLTIWNNDTSIETYSACEPFTWIDGITYTESNFEAMHTLTNIHGCDSVVKLNLTLNIIDLSINLDSPPTLISNQEDAIYQWVNCDQGYEEIPGATDQTFTATENGNYAVIIQLEDCIDTSDCVLIDNMGIIDQIKSYETKIYPNPNTDGAVWVDLPDVGNQISLTLFDVSGKIIYEDYCTPNTTIFLDLNLAPGNYFIRLDSDYEQIGVYSIITQ